MTSTLFTLSGFEVTLMGVIVAVAVAQWLVFVSASMLSRAKSPKSGLRGSERRLIGSSVLFVALWMVAFDGRELIGWKASAATAQASAIPTRTTRGSCALIENEMTEAKVREKLGEPDEKRPNDEIRGPGATIWVYRDSRCAVHVFDGRVEFIE